MPASTCTLVQQATLREVSVGRKATGQVIELPRARGRVYALRFRAYGKRRYMTLGSSEDGWTHDKAEQELQNVLADLRRGIWKEPAPSRAAEESKPEPTFHEFASEWMAARKLEDLSPRTIEDYEWCLSYHLLPFFKDHRLTEITVREVDRFKVEKVAEGVLGPGSINKMLTRLSQVLAVAVEYELISANPAEGRRRRLKVKQTPRSLVEPEQLMTLLGVADDEPALYGGRGRTMLAVLAGTGLRISEALALRRRAINLARGTLTVEASKTEAGHRIVDLTPALRDELAITWRPHPGRTPTILSSRPGPGEWTTATTSAAG
jgi:integrase